MKALDRALLLILIMFGAWFIMSWINICVNNVQPEPVYAAWNMITLMLP